MSDQPTPQNPAPAVPAAKPPGPPLVMVIGIALGALAIGGAAGALVVGPQIVAMRRAAPDSTAIAKRDAKDGKPGDKDDGQPLFRIDNVIVNPAGSQGSRFLLCSVAIELPDTKTTDRFRAREAEIRDLIITTVQRRTLEELAAPGARDTLKRDLAAALAPLAGGTRPKVYLPQFVVQ